VSLRYCHTPCPVYINGTSDYYPFGMLMETRSFTSGEYRFGFNGKEKDDEIKGAGNAVDFGARIYVGRLGKWLSVDPWQNQYSGMGAYASMLNSPIQAYDPNGEWVKIITTKYYGEIDNLKVKKWHNVFKKTSLIEKNIIIGKVRFFDSDPNKFSPEQKNQITSNYTFQIEQAFSNKIFKSKNKPDIRTNVFFEGDPEFIENLDELNGNEELIIIGNLLTDKSGSNGISDIFNRSLMGVSYNSALRKVNLGTFSHEFGHQRSKYGIKELFFQTFVNPLKKYPEDAGYFDHIQGGIYDTDPVESNYENAASIGKESKGVNLRKLRRELSKN